MKQKKIVVVFLSVLMILACVGVGFFTYFASQPSTVAITEDQGYIFDQVDIHTTIDQTNVYTVEQTMTVSFGSSHDYGVSRGIYVYIPENISTTLVHQGKQYDREYKVDIEVLDTSSDQESAYQTLETSIFKDNGNTVIQMRHEYPVNDKTVVFKVKYKMDLGYDKIKDFDFVYYNLWGNFFTTGVKNFNFAITFPEGYEFEQDNVYLYQGHYGDSTEQDVSTLSYHDTTNTLTGSLQNIPYATGVTLLTYLPEGFFTTKGNMTIVWALCMAVALAILTVIIFYLGKKDRKEPIEKVELTPPEGMDPLVFSQVLNHHLHQDIGYNILYWANRGYIKIHNLQHDNHGSVELEKVKDIDEKEAKHQKDLFTSIFHNIAIGEKVSIDSIQISYGTYSLATTYLSGNYGSSLKETSIIGMGVLAILVALLTSFGIRFVDRLAGIGNWLYVIPIMLTLNCALFFTTYRKKIAPKNFKKFCYFFPIVIILLSFIFKNYGNIVAIVLSFLMAMLLYQEKPSARYTKSSHAWSSALIILGVVFVWWYAMYVPWADIFGISILLGLLCAIDMFLVSKLLRYNPFNLEQIGKVLGYREKLLVADVQEIETMVSQNPHYYFDVLPYVYVMGIADEFSKKFENITIESPDWYQGSPIVQLVMWDTMLRTTTKTLRSHIQTVNVSSMRGMRGSSGRGGFSGGGFSGGGFGGGGGGRC